MRLACFNCFCVLFWPLLPGPGSSSCARPLELGDEDRKKTCRHFVFSRSRNERRFAAYRADPSSFDPTLRRLVLNIVARHADAGVWDQLHDLARAAKTPPIPRAATISARTSSPI